MNANENTEGSDPPTGMYVDANEWNDMCRAYRVVRAVAKIKPFRIDEESYDFPQDRDCVFCGRSKRLDDGIPPHADDCAWVLACKLTGWAR